MHTILVKVGLCPFVRGENCMPRIVKSRKICYIPKSKVFRPDCRNPQSAVLTLDELEAVRLADLEMLDQDAASVRMEVSRATFQRILHSAHRNIADALVNGKIIQIGGGKYMVADNHCNSEKSCLNCRFEEKNKGESSNE